MAETPHIAGAAHIKVGTGAGAALESLGYTDNGAQVTAQAYIEPIPGDENGGDAGPPIELNYLGETYRVRLELTKWDAAVADKIACRTRGGTAGTPTAAGTLIFANSYDFRVLIHTTTTPFNFLRTVPSEPITINKGTRYSRLVLEFIAYKNASGVMYNAVTV